MKVFISWSGSRSKAVGELLNDWLQCVLQAIDPWMSSKDVDRGSLWFSQINDQLKNTGTGIVCITSSNLNKPWILFESGALAKGLSSNRVCTFLVDISPADISDPLAQFNHTLPTEDGIWSLVKTLNDTLDESKLSENILENVFHTYWPQFKMKFEKIIEDTKDDVVTIERNEGDMLDEILYATRSLEKRLRNIENKTTFNRIQNEENERIYYNNIPSNIEELEMKNIYNDFVLQDDKLRLLLDAKISDLGVTNITDNKELKFRNKK